MELNRSISILILLAFASAVNNEKTNDSHTCPFSKIIEDIFKLKKHSGKQTNSDKEKLILHSIANITNNKDISEDDLVNVIIAAINNIKNNITKENNKINEAIILMPNSTAKPAKVTQIKSGIEEKTDVSNEIKKLINEASKNVTEKPNYIEILTIEPNNTQKNNLTSHNIVEALKHLMPMFNSTPTKELHNITIIQSNINRNHSFTASKNVSTIIVTYCDKDHKNSTIISDEDKDTTEYLEVSDDNEGLDVDVDEEEKEVTAGEKKDILEAAEYGMQKMHELYSVLEPKLYSMGLWLDDTNPARYVAAFNAPSEDSARFTRYGYASLQAATRLKELNSASNDGLESRTEDVQFPTATALRQSPLMEHCPLKGPPKCPPASKRYRTHDGTCNNLHRPRWGSTMTPVQRFLPPSYSDGLQAPRRSIFGSILPSAREISSLVHQNNDVESPGITHLLMQWGQFLDHDVTSSSQSRGFNGSVPRCCKDGGRDFVPKDLMHPECFPIRVPPSDPFYGPRGVRCLDFVRSSPAPRDDCALGWREQLNQVSAYIDGSPLYGSSARQSDKLRLFRNGMLQYGRVQQRRPILPPDRSDELCRGGAVSADCFKSGDARVNEHPGLVAAHIVWLRQHNRMAQELAHLNPQWSDEKIYQETRKIVGAMIQHITYKEFLPIVLGSDVMEIFELEPLKKGYFKHYDPKINPSPASSFGSAAFRFGHSLVQPSMMRYDRFHRPMRNNVSLHNELTNPSNIWSMGAVDRLLLGMLNQPIQKRDEFITEELTNHLFQTPSFDFGMDLAAINVQRGRDHGVPSYTAFREPCGLSEITEFEKLLKVMPARVVRKLKFLYRHVDDIDLFTGGMAERPVVGGLVGPTFACIIAQQFSNLRKGDRFWYENGGFDSSFTPAQLQQIRRISLAQVLCRTLDTIDSVQPFVFLSPDHPDNDRVSCQNGRLNNFDLSPWIELDSEFNNEVQKSEDISTQKPKRTKPTTPKPTTTTKKLSNKPTTTSKVTSKPTNKSQTVGTKNITMTTEKVTNDKYDSVNMTAKENDLDNTTLIDKPDTNTTVQIDDKLDFRNKSKRLEDTDVVFRNRPTRKYSDYDYEDEDTQSVQSVVVNNAPHQRPYNYKRPLLTVTENTNKYTYLINYVPRPTESWRQTTRRHYDRDRDVVKVTYQTYDDTYRRPNKPYYYNRHDLNDNNYRYNRPTRRRTTIDDYFSSRSYDNFDRTTPRPRPSHKTDNIDITQFENNDKADINDKQKTDKPETKDKTDFPSTTPKDMYKLVTFGYVGSYIGDMDDKTNLKTDEKDKLETISKDFSTFTTKKPDDHKTDGQRLSTFYLYDTSTKAYNQQRSTRLNDDYLDNSRPNKYYFMNNEFDKQTDTETKTEPTPRDRDIIKENYNNPGKPSDDIEERSSLDDMPDLDAIEGKTANKLKISAKKPSKPAQTPSVAFQIIPSEISPSQWAVYDEDTSIPEEPVHRMPPLKTDPYALKEIPRPISLLGFRRRRPGFV